MQALILAAGLGTRLKPITDSTPKCLVEIKGKKLLEIWFEKLENIGVRNFIINTHYLSEKVESFIKESRFRNKVTISYEKKLLGTAGTLSQNINSITEDLVFLHADNFTTDDLKLLIENHRSRPKNCLMTMLTFKTNNPKNCGIVQVNHNNVMIDFIEKPKNYIGSEANGAIYILSKEFLKIFRAKYHKAFDFSYDVIPNFKNQIYTFHTNSFFVDIGSEKNLRLANDTTI